MGLIAGILLVLLSFAHNIYGEKKQIPDLKAITNDPVMIGSLRVMIFQGGILLLAVGIIQILIALGTIELTGIARFFPVGIVLLDFVTFLVITALFHRDLFRITIPQIVLFVLIIALQLGSISG
ncbi:MAG: hypothetical protein CL610_27920 [Anaerolineaceae bacterium]|nr:hypothetical protein [Anaerolineaceae bacterium]